MVLTDEATSRQFTTIYSPAIDSGFGFVLSWKGETAGMRSQFFTDIEEASAFAAARAAERCDVWTSVALYREAPASGRGAADETAGLVGFFADLDVKPGAFESKQAARKFIEGVFHGVAPSMIVDSGAGLHAWFLFAEPWVFDTADERQRAKALAKRFVDSVRAAARGRRVDPVGDLARILRVAGLMNFSRGSGKDGAERPTTIVAPDADAQIRRYLVGDLEAVMVDESLTSRRQSTSPAPLVEALLISRERAVPDVVSSLCANDERFRATWERRRSDLKDRSASGYCMAIANTLVRHGASNQEVADAMIGWRRSHGEDLKLRPDLYRRTIEKARCSAGVAMPSAADDLPSVQVHDGRHLRDHSAAALAAIVRSNEPTPSIFIRGGTLARVKTSEEGRLVIEPLGLDSLRGVMERAASFVTVTKEGELKPLPPPMDVVKDVLALPEWPGIPPLLGIVTSPRVRPDGTILAEPGYDAATKLYLAPGGEGVEVPDAPTQEDARLAAERIIKGPLADFPFVSDADRANALGFALSIIARPAIAGSVPVAIFDARSGQGTGKSLLVRTLSLIACGTEPAMGPLPGDEEEWRKTLLPLLMRGGDVAVFDNAIRPVESGTFANVVTSPVFEDRILGASRRVEVPVRCAFAVTGNRITLGGDMARRCFPIELDARVERPEDREGFRHPDLAAWVRANRRDLLRAMLIMARAWWAAGRPEPSLKAWGSFEEYSRVVGGILEHAGVRQFLANRREFREAADDERSEWAAFLSVLHGAFGERFFQAREVAERLGKPEVGSIPFGVLPGDLGETCNRPGIAKRIGLSLAKWAGRVVGGLTLEVARDSHAKVRTFRVIRAQARTIRAAEEAT